MSAHKNVDIKISVIVIWTAIKLEGHVVITQSVVIFLILIEFGSYLLPIVLVDFITDHSTLIVFASLC